ncbi:hypothetical protein SAMN04488552_0535 [Christiangramia echinicola]|uniref:Uncharacterized protein n=1 Tax=Christiangramia echinicola TaxID=279359 RepID=A0A1H1L3G0_9FLAO|nr:hypothetical protein SAMN04488552_0535 [Christiangramia echinicola]
MHPYLKEISLFSKYGFINGRLEDVNEDIKIINVHWPEAIFGWSEPTEEELDRLEMQISECKKTAKLVYTKHDYLRNKGTTKNFTRLFKIIEENSDAFIHLGEKSKSIYQKLYPSAIHTRIYHPLFKNTFQTFTKEEARNTLGIQKDAFVIIVPGQIRTHKERDMILKAFKGLEFKKRQKVLIATNMRTELRYDFPGRVRLKPFFDFQNFFKERFKGSHTPPTFYFNYSHLDEKEYSLRFSASDMVLIPRINILNSGNIFLGLALNKIVVGPGIGNMEEILKQNGLPVFNPDSHRSIKSAIEEGIKLSNSKEFEFSNTHEYDPEIIAREYDDFLKSLL